MLVDGALQASALTRSCWIVLAQVEVYIQYSDQMHMAIRRRCLNVRTTTSIRVAYAGQATGCQVAHPG